MSPVVKKTKPQSAKKQPPSASPSKASSVFTFKASPAKPLSASKHDGLASNRFRNEALERETEKINAEFQAVLMQHSKQRERLEARVFTDELGMDKFYEIMGEFYENNLRKHASPTKRLMQQKEAAWKHKEFL